MTRHNIPSDRERAKRLRESLIYFVAVGVSQEVVSKYQSQLNEIEQTIAQDKAHNKAIKQAQA